MVRGLVIAAVAVTGCGAARATTSAAPEPSPPPSCPEQRCPEPSCPAPPPCPEIPRNVSQLLAAQGESGFWCWRRTAGKMVGEGECYRRKAACDDWHGLAVKHGNAPTECTKMERAVCFDIADHRTQKIYYRCLYTPEDCELLRDEMAAKYPEYQPGECRSTT